MAGDAAEGPRAVSTSEAPSAIGPYSQAVAARGFLFTAGQVGIDPATGELVPGDVAAQARQALHNLVAVLEAAGTGPERVVKTTVYLADMADFEAVNQVYAEAFRPPYPARSAVQAARLPRGARVEIEAVALLAG